MRALPQTPPVPVAPTARVAPGLMAAAVAPDRLMFGFNRAVFPGKAIV